MSMSVSEDGALVRRLDAVIDNAVVKGTVVGTVVLVACDGRLAYRRAAGFADREAGRTMTEDTIFRLASVTKPIVSTVALALAEQGVLRLDDAVEKFIAAFRPRLADGVTPPVTIRHLMTHTSGLAYGFAQGADGPYLRAGVSDGLDTPGRSIDDNIARIVTVPLSYVPGSSWAYSVATDVLGEALARAAGTSLPDLVEKLVAKPLGMNDTAFTVRDRDRLARAYADDAAGPVPMAAQHRVSYGDGAISFAPDRTFDGSSFASGGAGLNGTAGEILSFLETLRTGGAPVLERESVEALGTDAIDGIDTGMPGWGWGLGFAVLRDPAAGMTPQSVGTWRWGGVYGHSWFVDRAAGVTMVALTNTAIAGMTGQFPDALRDAVYGKSPV